MPTAKKKVPVKSPATKKIKKVFYAVESDIPKEDESNEIYLYESIDKAYREHLDNVGVGKAGTTPYLFKVEIVGKIKMNISIE
jgi:hypothetical protein